MEYCVRYVELPLAVNGLTVLDADGFYNIYINAAHKREMQPQTLARVKTFSIWFPRPVSNRPIH